MSVKERGICPYCDREYYLRGDGTLAAHCPPVGSEVPKSPGGNCAGSYESRPRTVGHTCEAES